jgi:four helix bundle protein
MKKAHNFRELKIWQESMKLVKMIYLLNQELPNDERFGLISQMNRCSISISTNIAEGSGRTSEKEFLHFLKISVRFSKKKVSDIFKKCVRHDKKRGRSKKI